MIIEILIDIFVNKIFYVLIATLIKIYAFSNIYYRLMYTSLSLSTHFNKIQLSAFLKFLVFIKLIDKTTDAFIYVII